MKTKMKHIIAVLSMVCLLSKASAQTPSENYIKSTNYLSEFKGDYTNFSETLFTSDILNVSSNAYSPNYSAYGVIAMNNNNLNIGVTSTWTTNYGLRLGIIKQLTTPNLPNTELGDLLANNEPSGYKAKLENGKLIFYSPYFINGIRANLTASIPQNNITYQSTINSFSSCGNEFTIANTISINNGVITLNISSRWNNTACSTGLVLGQKVYLDTAPLPNMELGVLSNIEETIYKAKIENNWLVFYTNETIPPHPLQANLSTTINLDVSNSDKIETVIYLDGLGRPKQNVELRETPNGYDKITHLEYDALGRSAKTYLPYPSSSLNNGDYIPSTTAKSETHAYYQTQYSSNYPYSETVFEPSTLNRVLESSAPGDDWRVTPNSNASHTVKQNYLVNQENEVKHFNVSHPNNNKEETLLVFKGYYDSATLHKTSTKNENWKTTDIKNNTVEEFKNKQGQVVLKRTYNDNQAHDTHYVYDNYGNLTYVIPPTASDEIINLGDQGYKVASQINYPWTDLVEVNTQTANEFNRSLKAYDDKTTLNADVTNKYNGQGGFTVTTNNNGLVTLSIGFSASEALALKQGELVSLKNFGDYKDTELGRISGSGYSYAFYIKNNAIVVSGRGVLPALNETFSSNTTLVYNQNYPWTKYTDVDPRFASNYEAQLSEYPNSDILNLVIENQYSGQGGVNISIDTNDVVSVNFNSSTASPLDLKKGASIPLNIRRRISDRDVGDISGSGYNYKVAIVNNTLIISGTGQATNIYGYFIAPPTATATANTPTVEGLCYIYHYDSRNRLIEKKIPSKDWEHIVYDALDRPILTQDANMRLNNDWLFTKYDAFGRIIYTGQHHFLPVGTQNNAGRLELQTLANNQTHFYETAGDSNISEQNLPYTKQTLPTNNLELYTVNYYDDYSFNVPTALAYSNSYNATLVDNTTGLVTGSKERVLDTNSWITTVSYYDTKKRAIYTATQNNYLNTIDILKNKLDFVGKVLETESSHTKDNNAPIVVADSYTYDHRQRLLTQVQTINYTNKELIINNSYDELGQLKIKKVGGNVAVSAPQNSNGLQTIDYNYNIRGWLTTINNAVLNNGDLFGYKLNYNNTDISGSTALFNGNISETHWITANDNKPRSYSYGYDALNRLQKADYFGNYTVADTNEAIEDYSVNTIGYDKNGNINTLKRFGLVLGTNTTNQIDIIDNLTYLYKPLSNTLASVSDTATADGFKDGNTTDNDYEYDSNGNMIIDKNKGITSITYNHLNLPKRIVFNGNDPLFSTTWEAIEYTYSATGVKLEKVVKSGGTNNFNTTKTTYAGNFIYKDVNTEESLDFFNQPEGYVEPHGNGYRYVYQYKDHLGNIRLSYSDYNGDNFIDIDASNGYQSEIVEENNYYPFGLKQQGYNNTIVGEHHPYSYNGKEEQNEFDINWYDLGARNHDPSIGRFMNIDPLAEDYVFQSTYAMAANNPVFFVDINGEGVEDDYGIDKKTGNITLIKKTDDKTDTLYAGTGEGVNFVKDESKGSVTIDQYKDGSSLISDLSMDNADVQIWELSSGEWENPTEDVAVNIAKTPNGYGKETFSVWKFAADNSIVEWSMQSYSIMPGSIEYQVGTYHKNDLAPSLKQPSSLATLISSIHSHPTEPNESGRIKSLFGDKGLMSSRVKSWGQNFNFYVYFPDTGRTSELIFKGRSMDRDVIKTKRNVKHKF